MSLGEGFGVEFSPGSGGWWGAVFLGKMREKGKGVGRVGRGVGTGKGSGKSTRKLCRNYSLAIYPLVSPRERGVPQAYVRARASSATLCSVHVLRVFLCIFFIKKGS